MASIDNMINRNLLPLKSGLVNIWFFLFVFFVLFCLVFVFFCFVFHIHYSVIEKRPVVGESHCRIQINGEIYLFWDLYIAKSRREKKQDVLMKKTKQS